jgi:hypothetical protein
MIGDPAQHTSVSAGGSFAALCRHDPDHTACGVWRAFSNEVPLRRWSRPSIQALP